MIRHTYIKNNVELISNTRLRKYVFVLRGGDYITHVSGLASVMSTHNNVTTTPWDGYEAYSVIIVDIATDEIVYSLVWSLHGN